MPQDGRPVVAEVRLLPYEEEAKPGEWSRDVAAVPNGGPPWETIRALSKGGALLQAQEINEYRLGRLDGAGDNEFPARIMRRFGFDPNAVSDVVQRRPRLGDAVLLEVARISAKAKRAPTQAVAEKLGYSHSNASKLRRRARERGYLTRDEKLTDTARQAAFR